MGREIKIELGSKLDDVIRILGEYRERGEEVWCVFNDYKLTSNDSFYDIYMKIFGYEKDNDVKNKSFLTGKEREFAIQYNIPFWINEGKKVIVPEKHVEWEACVNSFINSQCYYLLVDDALDIMYELEAGSSIDYVKEIFISQEHSVNDSFIVKNIVYMFSKRGKEFFDAVSDYTVFYNHVKKLVK